MKIETIEIYNFKSIGVNPPLVLKIGNINILAGTNDSGKSSILSASYIGLKNAINSNYSSSSSVLSTLVKGSNHYKGFEEEEAEQCVKVGFKCTKAEVDLIFDSITKDGSLKERVENLMKRDIMITEVSVRQFIGNVIVYLNIPIHADFLIFSDFIKFDPWIKTAENHFGFKQMNDFFYYLLEVITSLTFLEKSVKNMVCTYVPSFTRNERDNYNEVGANDINEKLTEIVSFFKEIGSEKGRRKGDYFKFMSYCKVLFPELERVDVNSPEGGELQEDLFLTWKKNGIERYQPLSRSGGGVYNTLFLLSKLINNYNKLNIVLIDEPESGLHPLLQQRFIKLLRKLSREFEVNWILATHSPFFIQNLKDNERLYLIEHNGVQSYAKEVEIVNKEEVFLSLGAYLPLTFSSNGIVFVEGQTEAIVLPILLNKVGFNIEKEGLLIIPLGGENLFKIDPRDIKRLHDKSMVIIDSDLIKSEKSGGNLKKIKIDFGESCSKNRVEFIMHRNFRTFENLYPKDIMAKVTEQELSDLKYSCFDKVPGINEKNKIRIGRIIANDMTVDQAKEFQLVKDILAWWEK